MTNVRRASVIMLSIEHDDGRQRTVDYMFVARFFLTFFLTLSKSVLVDEMKFRQDSVNIPSEIGHSNTSYSSFLSNNVTRQPDKIETMTYNQGNCTDLITAFRIRFGRVD